MPVGASDDPRHILLNPYHYSHTAYRGTHAHCRQRCLRRLCKYLSDQCPYYFFTTY